MKMRQWLVVLDQIIYNMPMQENDEESIMRYFYWFILI